MTDVDTHHVEISNEGTMTHIRMDGEEVKMVRGLQYTAVANKPPVLTLEVWGMDSVIQSDAIVRTIVVDPMHTEPGPSLAEFLDRINPGELDAEVLNRMDWSPKTNGELVLEVLREWANEHTRT